MSELTADGRWKFGTVIRMNGCTAMVVVDDGHDFKAISLAGEWADKHMSNGHYGYGKVWNWVIPRGDWKVVSGP